MKSVKNKLNGVKTFFVDSGDSYYHRREWIRCLVSPPVLREMIQLCLDNPMENLRWVSWYTMVDSVKNEISKK